MFRTFFGKNQGVSEALEGQFHIHALFDRSLWVSRGIKFSQMQLTDPKC